MSEVIAFRRLTAADLALMHRWLAAPHVSRWWGPPETLAEVEEHYRGCLDGVEPVDPYVILLDGRPIGYVQTYMVRDFPEYLAVVGAGDAAAGLDLFIGEPELIGRGLGPRIIRQFVDDVVFARPEVAVCTIDPCVANRAAIRAYEKVGFTYVRTIPPTNQPEPDQVMILHRPAGP